MKRRRAVGIGVALASVAALAGLWCVDDVRQEAGNLYLSLTGNWWKLRGCARTVTFFSPALGERRTVRVYLPPGYDDPANHGRRYPTLYLLHGFPDWGDGWWRYGHAPQEIDRLIVEGQLPPLIVVAPDGHGRGGSFGDVEYLDRSGTKMATFIVRDLVGWADTTWRTVPAPRHRLLGGDSTGGYGALNLGLQHPEIWGQLLAFSGYFRADPRHFAASLWGRSPAADALARQSPQAIVDSADPALRARWSNLRVFLGEGAREREAVTRACAFADALRRAGVACRLSIAPGGHEWDLWRAQLREALTRGASSWSKE